MAITSIEGAARRVLVGILIGAAGGAGDAFASCGSAFCAINTGWDVQGGWAQSGSRLDLRYEALTQDQPRAGGRNVAVGELPRHHDEVVTRNRNWLATYDHAFNADWGLSASLPLVDRQHEHIHNHHGAQLPEAWDFRAVGDLRLLARHRLAATSSREPPSMGAMGLTFGVKLPTGRTDVRNAEGDLAERSLQPGSGTTDALLGAFVTRSLPLRNLSWFAQGLLQAPMNARAGYRPGVRLGLDAGMRYEASERWSLMLQVNALLRGRDRGPQAEPEDTGGSGLWAAPGASYAVTKDAQLYAFLQLPIAQYANGVQLVARRAAVLGVSLRF